MTKYNKYIILSAILFFLIINSFFVVDQRQSALVLQFGKVIKSLDSPGLKFKTPFIQNVVFFDKRILDLGIAEQEVIASDQKRLIINAFTKYKIINPLKFYTTVTNKRGAEKKLSAIFDSSLRKTIGEFPLKDLLSDNRSLIMSKIKANLINESKIFGVKIIDVRIMRGDLPQENSNAIFTRMQTEREKEAREIRATGSEKAVKIKAEANKDRVVLIAEAKKQSNIIRGQGEAISNKIFARAFSIDPSFFDFYRSMKAYEKAIQEDNTTIVISVDNEFFKYIK